MARHHSSYLLHGGLQNLVLTRNSVVSIINCNRLINYHLTLLYVSEASLWYFGASFKLSEALFVHS